MYFFWRGGGRNVEVHSSWGSLFCSDLACLQGPMYNCHPASSLHCSRGGSLSCFYDGSLLHRSHVFHFLVFLPYFGWEHHLVVDQNKEARGVKILGSYMSDQDFVLFSHTACCLVRYRCLRWKSCFWRIYERIAPNFWASSVAIEKSDAILLLDPLNLDLLFF